jgi:hypothetical protein
MRIVLPPVSFQHKGPCPALSASSARHSFEVVGPTPLLGPVAVVALGVRLELHFVGVDDLAAAVLALQYVSHVT